MATSFEYKKYILEQLSLLDNDIKNVVLSKVKVTEKQTKNN